jgi:cytochrome c peroxidase
MKSLVHLVSGLIVGTALGFPAWGAAPTALIEFSEAEVRSIVQHGPWPVRWSEDPSNRVSGNTHAIDLGERLFFDPRLSTTGKVSCATCHQPGHGWSDGRQRGTGIAEVDRNTPSLFNVRLNRWFGRDGAADSLWSQSIRPIVNARELGASAAHMAGLLRRDADLSCRYEKTFGRLPPADDEALLVDIGKALAAFQETLVSGRTAFDAFRDALERGDRQAAAHYSDAAQRGLKIFIGKGACNTCHIGPNFTNGEFHDVGISQFVRPGEVDPGRHRGIRQVTASRFNLLGPYSDDPTRATATGTRHVVLEHRHFGEFKVPGLRNATFSAPYMHNGQLATLGDVVRYYSEINIDRLHADGEQILKPLKLSAREATDLAVFLETLADYGAPWRGSKPGDGPACR